MLEYVIRRLFLALLTTLLITILSFAIIQLPPGDYITSYVASLQASGTAISTEQANALRELYGLDQPLYMQYLKWMGQIARGNFGISMGWGRPVLEVIGDRIFMTAVVSIGAIFFTWIIALPIGIYSAMRQYSVADYAFTFIGFIGLAIPNFLLALALMYFAFVFFDTSIGGLFSLEYMLAPWSLAKVWDMLKHLPIPAIVLGLGGTAGLIRIMRANLLDELHKPYVLTARAKGLSHNRVIWRYPVRVALNPFVSTLGYLFPFVVSGSIIVSVVLSLPTVGPVLLGALSSQDMFLAGTIVMLLGFLTVIGTLISDLLLVWIDPRIRFEGR